ncbi:MAG TPA: AmpG family muropeptide MFS transporter [Thermoanaerobaculia bacterium]|nr:AmpG family muropeptide MFS transporter [Thermoanaerobaculia bacterium]
MLVILLLGFSSGLPFALSFTTLSVWFTEVGVRKADIGLFVLVGLPYSWKFLWAPFLDRVPVPFLTRRLGQRRSWALVTQVGLMASLVWLGSLDPARELVLMAYAAILVVFMAASQDVVIDAYRIEILRDEEQGAGSAATQYGYRVGMLASGAGALYLSDHMSWFAVYVIEAALLVIGMATVLFAREPSGRRGAASATAVDSEVGPARPAGGILREIVIDPFADFLRRPWWALVLAFVVLYRFPDAFLSVMANVFYKDIGFTNTEIASVSKLFGFAATLTGVFVGGLVVHRYGVLKGLFLCGIGQMLSNLAYVVMAQVGNNIPVFAATITFENVAGGMSGVAFIAYLSSLCSRGFAGSQYALLSALGLSTRNTLSAASGWLAEAVGWSWFFVLSTAVAIPGMALLAFFLLSGRFDRQPDAGAAASPV